VHAAASTASVAAPASAYTLPRRRGTMVSMAAPETSLGWGMWIFFAAQRMMLHLFASSVPTALQHGLALRRGCFRVVLSEYGQPPVSDIGQ
jgi:hypothetical protein